MENLDTVILQLGVKYERAIQARDYDTAIDAERTASKIELEQPDYFLPTSFIRGRNAVRRSRGQELVHL